MAFNINSKVFSFYAVTTAAVLTIAACGGGGGTSSSAGGGAAGTATVAGVVDNGGLASLDIWNGGSATTSEKLVASLAKWMSKPALAAPVVGATVDLSCGGDGSFNASTTTDVNGEFMFTGVPPATCAISVNDVPATQFEAAAGSVVNINVTVAAGEVVGETLTVRGTVDDGVDDNVNGNDNVAGDDDSSSEDSVSTASSDDDSGSDDNTSAANNDNTDPGTGGDTTANDNGASQSV